MAGEVDEDEGVPGWIPPDDVRVLGKLFWGRRKAREKGPEEEGRYVSGQCVRCVLHTKFTFLFRKQWAPFAEMQSRRSFF
jgi:hypothetical protein